MTKRYKSASAFRYDTFGGVYRSLKDKTHAYGRAFFSLRRLNERNIKMEKTVQNTFLETEKTGKLMRKFALPCIVSLLVGALYNIVDQIFIANANYLGSFGNAANSVVFPTTVIALAIATMIGDGCCAFTSINLGAKRPEKAEKGVGNAIFLLVSSGIVLAAIYLIFADPILKAFGATVNEETFEMSREYFFWIALGVPFYMFGQGLNPIIRSDGSPTFAMISLLAGRSATVFSTQYSFILSNGAWRAPRSQPFWVR